MEGNEYSSIESDPNGPFITVVTVDGGTQNGNKLTVITPTEIPDFLPLASKNLEDSEISAGAYVTVVALGKNEPQNENFDTYKDSLANHKENIDNNNTSIVNIFNEIESNLKVSYETNERDDFDSKFGNNYANDHCEIIHNFTKNEENSSCEILPNFHKKQKSIVSIEETISEICEIVTVYRLPGERLGFGLRFDSSSLDPNVNVKRLFIQSCAESSPAAKATPSWGYLVEGDEIIEIQNILVSSLSRNDCVQLLKDSSVAVTLLVKHIFPCGENMSNSEVDNFNLCHENNFDLRRDETNFSSSRNGQEFMINENNRDENMNYASNENMYENDFEGYMRDDVDFRNDENNYLRNENNEMPISVSDENNILILSSPEESLPPLLPKITARDSLRCYKRGATPDIKLKPPAEFDDYSDNLNQMNSPRPPYNNNFINNHLENSNYFDNRPLSNCESLFDEGTASTRSTVISRMSIISMMNHQNFFTSKFNSSSMENIHGNRQCFIETREKNELRSKSSCETEFSIEPPPFFQDTTIRNSDSKNEKEFKNVERAKKPILVRSKSLVNISYDDNFYGDYNETNEFKFGNYYETQTRSKSACGAPITNYYFNPEDEELASFAQELGEEEEEEEEAENKNNKNEEDEVVIRIEWLHEIEEEAQVLENNEEDFNLVHVLLRSAYQCKISKDEESEKIEEEEPKEDEKIEEGGEVFELFDTMEHNNGVIESLSTNGTQSVVLSSTQEEPLNNNEEIHEESGLEQSKLDDSLEFSENSKQDDEYYENYENEAVENYEVEDDDEGKKVKVVEMHVKKVLQECNTFIDNIADEDELEKLSSYLEEAYNVELTLAAEPHQQYQPQQDVMSIIEEEDEEEVGEIVEEGDKMILSEILLVRPRPVATIQQLHTTPSLIPILHQENGVKNKETEGKVLILSEEDQHKPIKDFKPIVPKRRGSKNSAKISSSLSSEKELVKTEEIFSSTYCSKALTKFERDEEKLSSSEGGENPSSQIPQLNTETQGSSADGAEVPIESFPPPPPPPVENGQEIPIMENTTKIAQLSSFSPPTFSRLPPDGDEFPNSWHDSPVPPPPLFRSELKFKELIISQNNLGPNPKNSNISNFPPPPPSSQPPADEEVAPPLPISVPPSENIQNFSNNLITNPTKSNSNFGSEGVRKMRVDPPPPPPARTHVEPSKKSVKDKIAMFTSRSSSIDESEKNSKISRSRANSLSKSSENLLIGAPMTLNSVTNSSAVSDKNKNSANKNSPSLNLIRKYSNNDSINSDKNEKKISYSDRSQSMVDVGDEANFSSKNPNSNSRSSAVILMEQRRKCMSKLRGLVIPDSLEISPKTNSSSVVDLPTILSSAPIISPFRAETFNFSPHDPCAKKQGNSVTSSNLKNNNSGRGTNNEISVENNKNAPEWNFPNSLSKYSPAFKRRTLTPYTSSPPKPKTNFETKDKNAPSKPLFETSKNEEPKSLESLTSPRSDSSFEYLSNISSEMPKIISVTTVSSLSSKNEKNGKIETKSSNGKIKEDSDNDSAVSSSRSSISHELSPPISPTPNLNGVNLVGDKEDDGNSGGEDESWRVLKPESVEAINRKNVLTGAKFSSGGGLLPPKHSNVNKNSTNTTSLSTTDNSSIVNSNAKNVRSDDEEGSYADAETEDTESSCSELEISKSRPKRFSNSTHHRKNSKETTYESNVSHSPQSSLDLGEISYGELTESPLQAIFDMEVKMAYINEICDALPTSRPSDTSSVPRYFSRRDSASTVIERVEIGNTTKERKMSSASLEGTFDVVDSCERRGRNRSSSGNDSDFSSSLSSSASYAEKNNENSLDKTKPKTSSPEQHKNNEELISSSKWTPIPLDKKFSKSLTSVAVLTPKLTPAASFSNINSPKTSLVDKKIERIIEKTVEKNSKVSSNPTIPRGRNDFRSLSEKWQQISTIDPKNGTKVVSNSSNKRTVSVNDIRRAFEKAEKEVNIGRSDNSESLMSPSSSKNSPSILSPPSAHFRVSSFDSTTSEESSSTTPGGLYGSVNSLLSNTTRGDPYGSITSLASSTSLISPQELQQLIDEANQSLEEAGTPSHEVSVVILHREFAGGSLGITLAGGADYETKEITVHKVLTGSIADRDARIHRGDRVLSINGKNTKGLTHRDALNLLKAPRTEVVLVVSRGRSPSTTGPGFSTIDETTVTLDRAVEPLLNSSLASLLENEEDGAYSWGPPRTVPLVKDGAGLGFSLDGGKGSIHGDKPLTIKKIFVGGPAEKSGELKVGDLITTINDAKMGNKSRTEAWNFMKKLGDGEVKLVVRSPLNY